MDYLGYSLTWAEGEDNIPARRLVAFGMQWRLDLGMHPYKLDVPQLFFERDPFMDHRNENVSSEFQVRPMGCVHGHNTITDSGFADLFGTDPNIPISPMFVRDLCGRTIYIGYGPEAKNADEWTAYPVVENPILPVVTFPRGCKQVTEKVQGADLIENVFFTKFRCLDMSSGPEARISGGEDLRVLGFYPNANLYPYKTRLDTFYIDGWKLPQTEMVYARQDVPKVEADVAGQELLDRWEKRPDGQDYEAFHEANNGDTWFEELFDRGCTVIPTMEACNGYNKVSADFELLDYWEGRAVPGLHVVMEEVDSTSPRGTILAVVEPGYVTSHSVKPAVVVISNGAAYISDNLNDPPAFIPNMFLPHQRTYGNWLSTWLPTHPAHFEIPAIWGWEGHTGRFLQKGGPIWDPLHYYYESVPLVLKAFEKPMKDNEWLAEVPEKMKTRFYPISEMKGYEVQDEALRSGREMMGQLPYSGGRMVSTKHNTCTIGYHPLPMGYEYELDTWLFPELDPRQREQGLPPEELVPLIAPVISTNITPEDYIKHVQAAEDQTWLLDESRLKAPTGNLQEDYPQIYRFLGSDDPVALFERLASVFLRYIPVKDLSASVQSLWPTGFDEAYDLDRIKYGLYDVVYGLREKAQKFRALRHKIFQNHYELYNMASWQCQKIDFLVKLVEVEQKSGASEAVQQEREQPKTNKETSLQSSPMLDAAMMGVDDL